MAPVPWDGLVVRWLRLWLSVLGVVLRPSGAVHARLPIAGVPTQVFPDLSSPSAAPTTKWSSRASLGPAANYDRCFPADVVPCVIARVAEPKPAAVPARASVRKPNTAPYRCRAGSGPDPEPVDDYRSCRWPRRYAGDLTLPDELHSSERPTELSSDGAHSPQLPPRNNYRLSWPV